MLPITRATVEKFCCSCLSELTQTMKVQLEEEDEELHKWFQTATAPSSSSSSSSMVDCINNYGKSMCNACYIKARLFSGFRDKAFCVTIARTEVVSEKRVNLKDMQKLRWFCITCLKNLRSLDGELVGYNLLDDNRLQDWLMDCLQITVDDINYVPTRICNRCFRILRSFAEFKRIAQESQEYLDIILGKNEEKDSSIGNHHSNNDNKDDEFLNSTTMLLYNDDNSFVIKEEVKLLNDDDPLNENTGDLNEYNALGDTSDDITNNLNEDITDNLASNKQTDKGDRILRNRNNKEKINSPKVENFISNSDDDVNSEYDFNREDDLNSDDTDGDEYQRRILTCPTYKRKKLSTDSSSSSSKKQVTKRVSSSKLIECEKCGKRFRKNFLYEAHVRGEHEGIEKPFICEKCPTDFKCYSNMRRHYIEVHNIDYNQEDENTRQLNLEEKLKSCKWKCSHCDMAFLTKGTLSDHIAKKHSGIKLHKCDYCLRAFKRRDHLCDHIKAVHHRIRAFKCSFCDKTFALRKTMRVHEMGHKGERPFTCEYCKKTFRQASDLKIHMEKHTTDPKLLCPICYRAKSSPEELQEHLAQHNSNGFQCTKCGKTFKKLSHLKDHDRAVHLLLRPYKCDLCDASFAAGKTLRVHRLRHTNEYPVQCFVCFRGFRANTNLRKHMRRVHKLPASTPIALSKESVNKNTAESTSKVEDDADIVTF